MELIIRFVWVMQKPLKEFLKIVGQVANDLHGGEPVELGFENNIKCHLFTDNNILMLQLYKDTGFKPLIPFRED
ncbi:MAG: hypothetical protein ACLU6Y_04555 [Ruminococcus sp.]